MGLDASDLTSTSGFAHSIVCHGGSTTVAAGTGGASVACLGEADSQVCRRLVKRLLRHFRQRLSAHFLPAFLHLVFVFDIYMGCLLQIHSISLSWQVVVRLS